jgi:putative peptide zinc metalloprotease protein
MERAVNAQAALPALREDLLLLPASPNRDGSPAWTIQDPVANRFYRIGWLECELLARWQASPAQLLAQVRAQTPLAADEGALAGLLQFLEQNCLLHAASPQASERLAAIAARQRRRDLRWLVHHYLFIRIPLVRPDRFLAATLPAVSFLFTRSFAVLMLVLGVIGLALAAQQWDSFLASVQDSFTPTGAVGYLAALAVAKLLHELGHAYTATRYGVRVAHMGVNLVVLFPMLYTDTAESWKLADRRQRLAIVAAGMLTEIGLAILATLAWSLTTDGALRSALFFLATTSWILSLGINASPFMRFDGYFLLSDLLDLPNLHARSSALARAFLRRHLLGWREPDPETLSPRLKRFLVAFAAVAWVYRLIVFAGIALSVYLFFFKALGILLFLLEIAWFIVMPAWSEIRIWRLRRAETPRIRRVLAFGLLAAAALFLFLPLPYAVNAPAWVRAERALPLYAPYPARLVQIQAAGPVQAGTVLLALDSPDTQARAARSAAISATLWSQLQRSGASGEEGDQRSLLSSRLEQELAENRGAAEEARRLVLTAPYGGVLQDLDPLIQPGSWVSPQQPLGMLVDPSAWIVDAYVDQESLRHLKPGNAARIYVTDRFAPLAATVLAVDSARTVALPDPMLDAAHGGPIRVSTANGRPEVHQSLYRVRLRLAQPPPSPRTQLARAAIDSAPHALGIEWLRTAASVLIRESGL